MTRVLLLGVTAALCVLAMHAPTLSAYLTLAAVTTFAAFVSLFIAETLS